MANSTLVNGSTGELVPVADRGFQFGDGVFETLAVRDGMPLCWTEHVDRLKEGCARLYMDSPDTALLRAEAARLCAGRPRAVLKIIISRGQGGRGYAIPHRTAPTRVLMMHDWPDDAVPLQRQGVNVIRSGICIGEQPALAGVKHLNRLENIIASRELSRQPASEALMFDQSGRVIEGTRSNLFVVKDGRVSTPDLSRCGVAGIVRGLILSLVAARGAGVEIGSLGENDLIGADEMFLCNSIIGIWPVRRYGAREYPLGDFALALVRELAERDCIINA